MSADQEFEGELFEDGVVDNVKFNFGKGTQNSAWLGDVLAAPPVAAQEGSQSTPGGVEPCGTACG